MPHDCKKSQRWTVRECGEVRHDHTFEDGTISHAIESNNYTNLLVFCCHECDREQNHSRLYAPKWLKRMMERVGVL